MTCTACNKSRNNQQNTRQVQNVELQKNVDNNKQKNVDIKQQLIDKKNLQRAKQLQLRTSTIKKLRP